MAGLSVLLDPQEHQQSERSPRILSKAIMMKAPPISHIFSSSLPPPPRPNTFLDSCFLCRKRLDQEKDIYMYRGDRAFCSVECRCKQMFMDEESVQQEKYCSFVAPSSSPSSHRKGSKTRPSAATAGGVAY